MSQEAALLKTLRRITGSEEAAYRSAGAVLGWIAFNAELLARRGNQCGSKALEALGRELNQTIDALPPPDQISIDQ